MGKDSVSPVCRHTGEAGLCALGVHLRSVGFWEPFEEGVAIPQKTVIYRPVDKLKTVVCTFLAGARHMVETNKRVRADVALWEAFGCAPCEQSVLQDTLSSCTEATVEQFRRARKTVFQRFSQAMRHRFRHGPLLLDIDLSGLICGKRAEAAKKGYFAHHKNQTGRQSGRVLASQYDEVVCEDVYAGTEQLAGALPILVQEANAVLGLKETQVHRTVLRCDGGGGTRDDIQWMVDAGYLFLSKLYAWHTAQALCRTVEHWIEDPRTPGRLVGAIPGPVEGYSDTVRFVGVRFVKANGRYGGGVIATNLSETDGDGRGGAVRRSSEPGAGSGQPFGPGAPFDRVPVRPERGRRGDVLQGRQAGAGVRPLQQETSVRPEDAPGLFGSGAQHRRMVPRLACGLCPGDAPIRHPAHAPGHPGFSGNRRHDQTVPCRPAHHRSTRTLRPPRPTRLLRPLRPTYRYTPFGRNLGRRLGMTCFCP